VSALSRVSSATVLLTTGAPWSFGLAATATSRPKALSRDPAERAQIVGNDLRKATGFSFFGGVDLQANTFDIGGCFATPPSGPRS
jgi:hypothetical protein